jgi:hypothetical protein
MITVRRNIPNSALTGQSEHVAGTGLTHTAADAIWCQAEWIDLKSRIGYIGVWAGCCQQAERIRGAVSAGTGIVVSVVVIVVAGFRVVVLAGETDRAVDAVCTDIGCGTPERGPNLPRRSAVGSDEFGGCASEVGDDGVEVLVVFGLVDLADRGEGAGCVLPGSRVSIGDLFDQGFAVPGEVDLLSDGCAVGIEALLGDASAKGVVAVAPPGAVRGGDGGEVVFAVP